MNDLGIQLGILEWYEEERRRSNDGGCHLYIQLEHDVIKLGVLTTPLS